MPVLKFYTVEKKFTGFILLHEHLFRSASLLLQQMILSPMNLPYRTYRSRRTVCGVFLYKFCHCLKL